MAPFYEGEHRLSPGDFVRIHTGPKAGTVQVLSDDLALVTPDAGSYVYVGVVKLRERRFEDNVRKVTEKEYVHRQSVSTNIGMPKILWRRK
ncbi:MAG: hypothetical protein AAB639_01070 [Patescibacteria group bacterium]